MISIIICSRSNAISSTLLNNIESTIGVQHEIITIDNLNNEHSICSAYNTGVKKSKFSIVCFMHDDIVYHTNNWGLTVQNHLNDEHIGAIGVAGTPYYSYMPGTWWGSGNIYTAVLPASDEATRSTVTRGIERSEKKEVVVLDGLWFCIKKTLFNKIQFDELNFKGFHFYDIDICMQMHNLGVKMYCIYDILIDHVSYGSLNNSWIVNALVFQKKWEHQLPASCIKTAYNQGCKFEYKALNGFIWICSANHWTNKKIYNLGLKFLLKFKKGYLFYKTPGYFIKFAYKMLFKKGEPFYFI